MTRNNKSPNWCMACKEILRNCECPRRCKKCWAWFPLKGMADKCRHTGGRPGKMLTG